MDLGAAVRSLEGTELWDSLANWDRKEVSDPSNPSVVGTVLVASLLALQMVQLVLPDGPSLQLSNLGGEGTRNVPPESTLRNHPKCGITTGGQVSTRKGISSLLYPIIFRRNVGGAVTSTPECPSHRQQCLLFWPMLLTSWRSSQTLIASETASPVR